MPLTQLMRKLRKSGSITQLQAMDIEGPSFEVTAEVTPTSGGRRSPCSVLSESSSDVAEGISIRPSQQQHQQQQVAVTSPRSAAVGPRPACPVSRAQRAKGKAVERSQSLVSEAHPAFLSRGSLTADQQRSGPLAQLVAAPSLDSTGDAVMQPGSYRVPFHRASTAPLPWSSQHHATAAVLNWDDGQGDAEAVNPAAVAAAASARHSADDDDRCDWEDGIVASWLQARQGDEELVSPAAVVAAADLNNAGDDDRCDWEDGVVASWLQGLDHSDLALSEHEDDTFQQHPPNDQLHLSKLHSAAPKARPSGLAASERTTSSMSGVSAVYGSLLYA